MIIMYDSIDYLNNLFDSISSQFICEELIFCNAVIEDCKKKIDYYKSEHNFDIIGIQKNGKITSFINTEKKEIKIKRDEVILKDRPLLEVSNKLLHNIRLFVEEDESIKYIITRGDLRKLPFRLYLFGIVNIFELYLNKIIVQKFPNNEWLQCLTFQRKRKAKRVKKTYKKRNEDISLFHYLQLCDKLKIIREIEEVKEFFNSMNFCSNNLRKKACSKIRILRDNLAHSRDIIRKISWKALFSTITLMKSFLKKNFLQ